jgi:Xaa-Pro aminopeptidase
MATLKDRVDKHDREIAAIRKLIHTGMKMLVKLEEEVRELATSQRETDRQLQAFIRSLRRGSNGHTNN